MTHRQYPSPYPGGLYPYHSLTFRLPTDSSAHHPSHNSSLVISQDQRARRQLSPPANTDNSPPSRVRYTSWLLYTATDWHDILRSYVDTLRKLLLDTRKRPLWTTGTVMVVVVVTEHRNNIVTTTGLVPPAPVPHHNNNNNSNQRMQDQQPQSWHSSGSARETTPQRRVRVWEYE